MNPGYRHAQQPGHISTCNRGEVCVTGLFAAGIFDRGGAAAGVSVQAPQIVRKITAATFCNESTRT